MAKKTGKKNSVRTDEFAKMAGVSKMAISKAVKSGHIIKKKKDTIDPSDKVNAGYIKANKSKRRSHKIAAEISKKSGAKGRQSKSSVKKKKSGKGKPKKVTTNKKAFSDDEVKQYVGKTQLETAKLAVETKLKQVQLAAALKELIPLKLVEQKLARFATVLQNTILILPEKLADNNVNIVLEKGADARADIVELWSKSLAAGIKESKKAIEEVTDYETKQLR